MQLWSRQEKLFTILLCLQRGLADSDFYFRSSFVIDIGIEDSDFASVVEWAEKYKNLLIKHWNGEIEDVDLIFAIRNLHRIDMGKTISDLHLDEDELICLKEAISILKNGRDSK